MMITLPKKMKERSRKVNSKVEVRSMSRVFFEKKLSLTYLLTYFTNIKKYIIYIIYIKKYIIYYMYRGVLFLKIEK